MKKLFLLVLLFLSLPSFSEEKLYIIPIQGDIEPSLRVFIRNSIEKANKEEANILFEINTFGGRVDTALKIASLIGSVRDKKTIAYIPSDPEGLGVSWSAGALISFSCNEIFMAEGTSIGAAAPVFISPEGTQNAGEKTVSAVRTQIASLAEKNGYSVQAVIAMVDLDVELYEEVENNIPYLRFKDELLDPETAKIISPKGKLLTLSAKQMEYYRQSKSTVDNLSDVLEVLNIKESNVTRLAPTSADNIVSLITSTTILGILISLGLICLYLELTSPGFGLLGALGLICFSIVFIGGQLLGTLNSLELLLFLIGVVLLIVEIFIIPGFGITGVLGISSIILSLILSQQDFIIPKWNWQWDILNRNIILVLSSLIGSSIFIAILMALFPRLSLFNRLILKQPVIENINIEKPALENGITITMLRPVGKIRLGSEIFIAKSQGKIIEKGVNVKVISHNDNEVIVKELKDETTF
ncbi:MAG: nodulation protein NfeD [Spirochaetaceae bacterium]